MKTAFKIGAVVVTLVALTAPASAQTYDSGSTGADGAFTLPNATCPTSPNCTLALPAGGEFHFTTVNIPSPWVVKFTKNASNTPVVIRASGNVTIAGTIDVSGANGGNGQQATTILGPNGGAGGPGGFNGGSGANGIVSTVGGTGGGPGGGIGGDVLASNQGLGGGGAGFALAGTNAPSPGGLGGSVYGTPTLLPTVGGSGGGGGGAVFGNSGGGAGGGGGAIVIASSGTITFGAAGVGGSILAKGGNGGTIGISCCPAGGGGGGGSGGSVRLAATTITSTGGNGLINVSGGLGFTGGTGNSGGGARGRIRIEAYNNTAQVNLVGAQASVVLQPKPVALPNTPTLRITAVAGVTTPTTPTASLGSPDVVLPATTTNPVQISLAAAQVPLGTTILVSVKGLTGASSSALSNGLSGTVASSTATASVTMPTNQPSIITASATFDLVASSGQGPFYAEGELVNRVRVAASLDGASEITYITTSGREIAAATR